MAQAVRSDQGQALFCLEPRGTGYLLVEELMRAGLPTWLAHPLDIKHSIGSTRGKNDRIDAQRIADYARRHHDKARLLGPGSLRMNKLKRAYVPTSTGDGQTPPSGEDQRPEPPWDRSLRALFDRLSQDGSTDRPQLEKIEAACGPHPCRYARALGWRGPVLAAHLLACTEGFTRFATARRLACQAGVAPYEHFRAPHPWSHTRISTSRPLKRCCIWRTG
ncbi:MAG: transposase [Flavobacteriales bacterium]|nr:transposase [Flavobacteriales bacterium]